MTTNVSSILAVVSPYMNRLGAARIVADLSVVGTVFGSGRRRHLGELLTVPRRLSLGAGAYDCQAGQHRRENERMSFDRARHDVTSLPET